MFLVISEKTHRGFTLVELLVVISIIVILAGIILITLGRATIRANDARIISEMSQIRSAAMIYYSNNNYSYTNFNCNITNPDMSILCNDIAARGGTNFIITSTGQEYCAEVQLNSGDWWCVDNKGISRKYNNNPSCTQNSVYSCE